MLINWKIPSLQLMYCNIFSFSYRCNSQNIVYLKEINISQSHLIILVMAQNGLITKCL